jgi:hypothetical protein
MAEIPSRNRWLEWSLASFHTALFVLILLVFLYARGSLGGLLSGLNTWTGFALYLVLWLVVWWTTGRALRRVRPHPLSDQVEVGSALSGGLVWGAATGVTFFAFLLLLFLARTLLAVSQGIASFDSLLAILFYGLIGALVAAVVGAVFGYAMAVLDFLLFSLSRKILGGMAPFNVRKEDESLR